MTSITTVIALLFGVALFLFGMSLMGDSLKKVAGSKLELILFRLSSTPLKGVLLGTGVTAVIQSSSATSVMVVGFVNSGMMKVRQAIGIILGALLGTSITGWIICLSDLGGGGWAKLFNAEVLSGIVAVIGIIFRMFSKNQTRRHVGDILLGFAVLMAGMTMMSNAVSPLKESPAFLKLLVSFSNPFLGVLVGIVITAILQSASAAVGILQALAVTGAVDFSVAFPLILGIMIGAAVPVLLSSVGAGAGGKRTAWIYLITSALGVLIFGTAFYLLSPILQFSFLHDSMTTVTVALTNTVFRFLTVLLLVPFIALLEKLVNALIRDRSGAEEENAEIDRLEDRFLQHPSIAIEQSRLAINSMARKAEANLTRACNLLYSYSDEGFRTVEEKENVVDRYEDKLGTYLVKINSRELDRVQNKQISKFLHTMSDFERISDHAVNIAETAREMDEKKIVFSPAGQRELDLIGSAIAEIVHLSFDAFINENLDVAMRVEPLEEWIDTLCDTMKLHHVARVQNGECTLGQGFVFNDLLSNYERVADHCSNIAVAMIELESELFDTHEYLKNIKSTRSEAFDTYLQEYREKYML